VKPVSKKIIGIALLLLLLVLFLAVFANSMTKPVGRDEQMYCTAAALMAQGKTIYQDFSYPSQMPYHPLLCAAVYKISGTTNYLLYARLISVLSNILTILCIIAIYRKIFKSYSASGMVLGLAAAAIYVFNPFVEYSNGYAWNHDIVIALVSLSLWLFISTDFKAKPQHLRIAAIAALLTLATCMRITTALVELVFFAALLTAPSDSHTNRFKRLLPFLTASAVILIWPISIIARNPQVFYLNLVKIPTLYGQWLHSVGIVHNKLQLITAGIFTPGYLILIAIAAYLGITSLILRKKNKATNTPATLLPWLLVATFIIIALIPPTLWRQYLAMPVPFLVIALAYPLLQLRKMATPTHYKIACTLITVCVIIATGNNPKVLSIIPTAFKPQNYKPTQTHKITQDIAEKVKEPKRLLTLGPLYALQANCDIYPQLSAGSIVYRIGDNLPPEERKLTNTVGVETLKDMIDSEAPSAVLLKVEPSYFAFLEEPLKKTIKPDWKKKTYPNGLILYYDDQ